MEKPVHLANTAAIQQYNGLKYTDDHGDARWLAHLLGWGCYPRVHLSQGRASGAWLVAQAGPARASEDGKPSQHPESDEQTLQLRL